LACKSGFIVLNKLYQLYVNEQLSIETFNIVVTSCIGI